jgi:ribose transport system permease protein
VIGGIDAIFLLAISVNGLTLLGAEAWVSDMFNGLALLVGVGISVFSGKRRRRGGAVAMPSDRGAEPDDDAAAPDIGDSGRLGPRTGSA